ncbi:UNVERIFIED_CONTAM: hypothetical protein K2H54_027739 [Gekko kuhli]
MPGCHLLVSQLSSDKYQLEDSASPVFGRMPLVDLLAADTDLWDVMGNKPKSQLVLVIKNPREGLSKLDSIPTTSRTGGFYQGRTVLNSGRKNCAKLRILSPHI